MLADFDARASTHGAAASGLVASFGLASILTLTGGYESNIAWGVCLILLGATFGITMWYFGSKVSAGLRRRMDLQASSNGAVGGCLTSLFIGFGLLAFFELWRPLAIGLCLAVISVSTLCGMLSFGLAGKGRKP